ncbi:MAG TPA: MFS transporter, partial [Candidatus Limnocylindria bacterium]|nr:MFS transporter [Candidatus Limnocylindria bacterium]
MPARIRWLRFPEGLRAFRHRNFRLFWAGQLVSLTGTWMQQVAQAWLVLTLTDDPLALGIVAAAQFGPILLLGLFGGIVADMVSKRSALIATQACASVLGFVLWALVAGGAIEVWMVYLLALSLGVVNSIDMPVRQAFVVEMVGRRDIANAVALNSAVFNG